MTDQNHPTDAFQVENPLAVFETFSTEEMQRCRDTDPNFDATLHQEAVSLVVNYLKAQLRAADLDRGTAS